MYAAPALQLHKTELKRDSDRWKRHQEERKANKNEDKENIQAEKKEIPQPHEGESHSQGPNKNGKQKH